VSEEIIFSLVEVYNLLANDLIHLTMTQSAAREIAWIYDQGSGLALQTAVLKTLNNVIRDEHSATTLTLLVRFYRNGVFFRYLVLASQTNSGVHIEMMIRIEKEEF
jgi:hypothetical protein